MCFTMGSGMFLAPLKRLSKKASRIGGRNQTEKKMIKDKLDHQSYLKGERVLDIYLIRLLYAVMLYAALLMAYHLY